MRAQPFLRTGPITLVILTLLTATVLLAGTIQADGDDRRPLPGTKPDWPTSQSDRGKTEDKAPFNARVHLAGADPAGLEAYARAVSDPRSPGYGRYLSPAQFRERFGPAPQQVQAVTSWLRSSGLEIAGTNDHYVAVRGTVAAAQRAFGTSFRNYLRHGRTLRAPVAEATVPAPVASAILTVTGLDSAEPRMHPAAGQLPAPAPVFATPQPCGRFFGDKIATDLPQAFGRHQPWAVCGYTPAQLRGAYGVTGSGLTGSGTRIAVVGAYTSPTITADVNEYARRHAQNSLGFAQYTENVPDSYSHAGPAECDARTWYGEQSLDVQAVRAMAPAADLIYVAASSCLDDDFADALARIIDGNLADVVTNSWDTLENEVTPATRRVYEQLFVQGAIEGIGLYFASGDNGDESLRTGRPQVTFPASSPWVTAVGGTSLGIGSHNEYLFETGWATSVSWLSGDRRSWTPLPPGQFHSGAGSGASSLYAQPSYQHGVVPDALGRSNKTSQPMRVVPDIAAVADPDTGMLIGQTQTFPDGRTRYAEYRAGGTSLACPIIAGLQALAQQAHGHARIGFANPALYQRAGTDAFHRVTGQPQGQATALAVVRADYTNHVDPARGMAYSLRCLARASSRDATAGYHAVTGLGSPTRGYLQSNAKKARPGG